MATLAYMRGPAGVGKSFLVKELQRRFKIPVVDYDDFKPALAPYVSEEVLRTLPYEMSRDCLKTILDGDIDVIFDSAGLWKREFDACMKEFGTTHRIVVIRCTCSDEELWKKRLANRESKLTQVDSFAQANKWFELEEQIDTDQMLEIDTAQDLEDNLSKIIHLIRPQ